MATKTQSKPKRSQPRSGKKVTKFWFVGNKEMALEHFISSLRAKYVWVYGMHADLVTPDPEDNESGWNRILWVISYCTGVEAKRIKEALGRDS